MRYSRLFIPTLKEAPAEAEAVSHKLMVRGGFVRQLAAGLYIYLPLGQRVMDKIDRIIREEMNAIGGQEVTHAGAAPGRDMAADRTVGHHRRRDVPAEGPRAAATCALP